MRRILGGSQGRTTTPEGGRKGLLSSGGGMKLSYVAKLLASSSVPATNKTMKMCPRKDIERAVGHISLKPTVVATDRSRSAQGVARPVPCCAEWQRHKWHPSRIWGGHKGGCVLLT